MKKIIFAITFLLLAAAPVLAANPAGRLSGYILLQVEAKGQAWYVYPETGQRYFLGRPADAFNIMKRLALGAKHDFIANTDVFPARLSGLILLDVEQNGQAYYIYPKDNKKYYLGRPDDAFNIMRRLGLGITDADLAKLPVAGSASGTILLNVPFTSQAPFGGWSDLRQEDGCEEASSLMAVSWAREQSFTKQQALDSILASSDYTLKKYGEYRDISLTDTLNWIIKDYFNYQKAAMRKNITANDIINELKKGNVIIAPMNGRLLHNPNYTAPGPVHHMLVVRGYDPVKNIFITNDPGTRKGELYEYGAATFFNAIADYPTGIYLTAPTIVKDIIVVSK